MVTDLSTPKFRCDLCNTDFTGASALDEAESCESHGAPTPLPADTWVLLNGFAEGHDLTVGGFKLVQVGQAEIKRSYFGLGHRVYYRGYGSAEMTDSNLHPHQPCVLNTVGVSSASLHGTELSSALREPDGSAADYAAMLSMFGVERTAAQVSAAAGASYSYDFLNAHSNRNLRALPPISSFSPEARAALLAVASPEAYDDPDQGRQQNHVDLAGRTRFQSKERYSHEASFDILNVTKGNAERTTARMLSFANPPAEESAAAWLDGAQTYLPSGMLRYDFGDASGDRRLDIKQRDLLRAAGFEVRWPTRLRNAHDSEINTPARALRAIIERYETTVELPDFENSLFAAPTKIGIVSGKGGVGKTTVAAAAGHALARAGNTTLVVDLDFHGPSLGSIYDLPPVTVGGPSDNPTIIPSKVAENLYAISLSQFIKPGAAVTWRSASVEGFLMFLAARLDTLGATHIVFDFPPGTGDVESAVFSGAKPDGIILVTTGSKLSHDDTRRAAAFARNYNVPVLGVVENLSYREVTMPSGESVNVRLFGELADTEAFTAGLVHDNRFGKKWTPQLLTSLPFVSNPAVLASTPEFTPITAAIAAPVDAFETTDDPEVRTFTFTMGE